MDTPTLLREAHLFYPPSPSKSKKHRATFAWSRVGGVVDAVNRRRLFLLAAGLLTVLVLTCILLTLTPTNGPSTETATAVTAVTELSDVQGIDEYEWPIVGGLRECAPSDLACRLLDIPRYPSSPRSSHTGRAAARQRQRVLLVVVNGGFAEMALNLVCTGEMVGSSTASVDEPATNEAPSWTHGRIPRTAWLMACADDESYEFFMERGIAAVRMNETSALTLSNEAEADNNNDAAPHSRPPGRVIGSDASSWGARTHIDINRAKVPLLLDLMVAGVDVLLLDADVVLLRPLDDLWGSTEEEDDDATDLQVMYDWPGITMPEFGPQLGDCLVHAESNTSRACRLVWEMNGGCYLLRSSERTIDLLNDMTQWLKDRPTDHDQDALRVAMRARAQTGRLAWRLEDGSLYPPPPPSTSIVEPAASPILSYRFFSNLLAPNGGLYLMSGRAAYLEASARAGVLQPVLVHVNWVVGHRRKQNLMHQHDWWRITRVRTKDGRRSAQCAHVVLAASRKASQQETLFVRPPSNHQRVHDTRTMRALTRPPFAQTPSATLLLVTTPKPVASFKSLPRRRAPDADNMGGYEPDLPEHDYPPEVRQAYLAEQAMQLRAQLMCFRNWFATTNMATMSTNDDEPTSSSTSSSSAPSSSLAPAPVQVAIFSRDVSHARLSRAMRFDHFSSFDADEYGMPRLHSLFRRAESLAHKRAIGAVMYTNGDLMYDPIELARTTALIQSYGFAHFLAVGMRRNVAPRTVDEQMTQRDREELARLNEILDNEQDDGQDVADDEHLRSSGGGSSDLRIDAANARAYFDRLSRLSRAYRTDALDFFLWSPGFFDFDVVPRFTLGRIAYDNWILHYANTRARADAAHGFGNSAVIDVSGTIDAIHIEHGSNTLKPVEVASSDSTTEGSSSSSSLDLAQQVLSRHSDLGSHFAPNTMDNIRLGGQASLKGLGRLEHVAWRTVRRASGELQLVKTRPEGGSLADLFDAAREAHTLVGGRPNLVVVAADNAHVPHLRNWIANMRRALRNDGDERRRRRTSRQGEDETDDQAGRMGILVLSGGSDVTLACRQLGVSVFDLAPGERGNSLLNGAAASASGAANLQLAGLRARAVSSLLEFGYDVLVGSVATIWKRNPFRVMAERAHVQGDGEEAEQTRTRQATQAPPARSSSSSSTTDSFNPASNIDGLTLGSGLDLIAFAYDSSLFNVSSSCVFYRATPATLKLWRRMLHELHALVQRATMPLQVNPAHLQLDWYLQYELFQSRASNTADEDAKGDALAWAVVTMASGVFTHPDLVSGGRPVRMPSAYSHLPHLPAGPIRDPDLVMANGWWFDRPGGLGAAFAADNLNRLRAADAWLDESQREPTKDSGAFNDEVDPCASKAGGLECGALSQAELDLVLATASADRSILLVPVVASDAAPAAAATDDNIAADERDLASTPLNIFLARVVEIGFRHIMLVCRDSALLKAALTLEHRQEKFAVLYGPGDGLNDAAAAARLPVFSLRLYHILSQGVAVGVVNLATALLFGSPFELYTNREHEFASQERRALVPDSALGDRASRKRATRAFLASRGLWRTSLPRSTPAMLRPHSDLLCDLHAHTASASTTEASANNASLLLVLEDGSAAETSWTFINMQPTEQTRALVGTLAQCARKEPNSATFSDTPPSSIDDGYGLHLACLQFASSVLQSSGLLAVCDLDPYYFPTSRSFFEPPPTNSVTPPNPTTSDVRVVARGGEVWKHVSETGVYPLVVPRRFENPLSGRTSEWAMDWRDKLPPTKTIAPPAPLVPNADDQQPWIRCQSGSSSSSGAVAPAAGFLFRIRVLTFTRARSLKRLLQSLVEADFLGDSGRIRLEVSVDRPEGEVASFASQEQELAAASGPPLPPDEDETSSSAPPKLSTSQQRSQVLSVLREFEWPHGDLAVTLHPRHLGLVGQWLSGGPLPISDRDLTLVLEDDMSLSPLFYSWLKGAICAYYLDPSNFDARLFGISLQKQHYVLGQSAKNHRYQFLRFQEEREKQQRWEQQEQKGHEDGTTAAATPPSSIITDAAALFDLPSTLGDPSRHPVFKYQLVGTWGLLVFPSHWRAFHAWWTEKQTINGEASTRPVDDLFEPCVPHVESSSWWRARRDRVWSQWLIRYAFDQGWYCLYPHTPDGTSFGVNHRESGANHAASLGARDAPLLVEPPISASLESFLSSSSHPRRFAFPPLATVPLFDFHWHRITVDPIVLQQRRALHTERQMRAACVLKDYKPFDE